jgi:hypothetical protein
VTEPVTNTMPYATEGLARMLAPGPMTAVQAGEQNGTPQPVALNADRSPSGDPANISPPPTATPRGPPSPTLAGQAGRHTLPPVAQPTLNA